MDGPIFGYYLMRSLLFRLNGVLLNGVVTNVLGAKPTSPNSSGCSASRVFNKMFLESSRAGSTFERKSVLSGINEILAGRLVAPARCKTEYVGLRSIEKQGYEFVIRFTLGTWISSCPCGGCSFSKQLNGLAALYNKELT